MSDATATRIRTTLTVKRIYDRPEPSDGIRILVDRLWPRGLTKERACVDLWYPEIAPSSRLRQWFGHDRARWIEFCRRYRREIGARTDLVRGILSKLVHQDVTLLYAAADERYNNARCLLEYLNDFSPIDD